VKFKYELFTITTPSNEKRLGETLRWSQIVDAHQHFLMNYPVGTAVIIKSYYYPVLKGVQYIAASEPHNGSIICLITGPVEIVEETLDLVKAWPNNKNFRDLCFSAAMMKTYFCFCREKVWERMPLRPSFFTGPPMAMILEDLEITEAGEQGYEFNEGPELFDIEDVDGSEDDEDDDVMDDTPPTEDRVYQSPLDANPQVKPKKVSTPAPPGPIDTRINPLAQAGNKRAGTVTDGRQRDEEDDEEEEPEQIPKAPKKKGGKTKRAPADGVKPNVVKKPDDDDEYSGLESLLN